MSGDGGSGSEEDGLVARARSGSDDAMVELYHRHRGLVIAYVLRMTGDRDLADEVFAATFASFFASLHRYRSRGHLAAYLLKIARSRLADEARARGRLGRPLPASRPGETPGSEPLDDLPGPAESAATAELSGLAEVALRELPGPLREVVVLRLHEGLDYATIAGIVGAGEATVRSRMRHALGSLRKSLGVLREP